MPAKAFPDSPLWQNPDTCAVNYEGDTAEAAKYLGFAKAHLRRMLKTSPGATSLPLKPVDGVDIEIYTRPNRIRITAGGGVLVTRIDPSSPATSGDGEYPPYQPRRDRFIYDKGYPEHKVKENYYAGVNHPHHPLRYSPTSYWYYKGKALSWTSVQPRLGSTRNPPSYLYLKGKYCEFPNNIMTAAIKGQEIRLLVEYEINNQFKYALLIYRYPTIQGNTTFTLSQLLSSSIAFDENREGRLRHAEFSGNATTLTVLFDNDALTKFVINNDDYSWQEADVPLNLKTSPFQTQSQTTTTPPNIEEFTPPGPIPYISTTSNTGQRLLPNEAVMSGFRSYGNKVYFVFLRITSQTSSKQTVETGYFEYYYGWKVHEEFSTITASAKLTVEVCLGIYDMNRGSRAEDVVLNSHSFNIAGSASGTPFALGLSGNSQSAGDENSELSLVGLCPEKNLVLYSLKRKSYNAGHTYTNAIVNGNTTITYSYTLWAWQNGVLSLLESNESNESNETVNYHYPGDHIDINLFIGIDYGSQYSNARYAENGKVLLCETITEDKKNHFFAYSIEKRQLLVSEFHDYDISGFPDYFKSSLSVTI